MKKRKEALLIKRLFDFVFSLIALIVLFPILVFISALIAFADGFPVFFTQIRPGKDGNPFKLIKFRTMKDIQSHSGVNFKDDDRITKLGNFLRKKSIDELPELFNVLKGEMSIVGPRPLLMQYLERYSKEQARRHEMLPGITGWAQVNGRNAISWEEKFRLDVWYVDNWSFWLDIQIIFKTIWSALKGEGISPDGQKIMDEFMGNRENQITE